MRNNPLVRAKANAHYTCQECGTTEMIQGHHEIPHDDNTIVVLCGECHHQCHPHLPKALFLSKCHQPYWHNKSASSLAKQWQISSRTVIRSAKRLAVPTGELTPGDEELIKQNIRKLQPPPPKPDRPIKVKRPLPEYRMPPSEFTFTTSDLMTIGDAALAVSRLPETIRRWVTQCKLRAVKLGGAYYVLTSEVDRLKKEAG